jgi:sarcosine oxidase gamma subunit
VLEIQRLDASVHLCLARRETLDRLSVPASYRLRTAPDEALLLDSSDAADLQNQLSSADPGGSVVDLTDGFALWRLGGADRHEAVARLSALPLPANGDFAQGLFARTPAKLMNRRDDYLVLVTSTVSEYVRQRLLTACHDLQPRELARSTLASAGRREAT